MFAFYFSVIEFVAVAVLKVCARKELSSFNKLTGALYVMMLFTFHAHFMGHFEF